MQYMFQRKQNRMWLAGCVALIILFYGLYLMTSENTPAWHNMAKLFIKNDKSDVAGDYFRINGNSIILFNINQPATAFKPIEHPEDPNAKVEYTEPWMGDVNERLNRRTVEFFRGTINDGLIRHFSHPGQDGAWAYSPNWNTIYISTDWVDFKDPDSSSPHTFTLWRSTDGGYTWKQLDWPRARSINQLFFLDAQRGYAVGWPSIWRTADGGHSWQEIKAPAIAKDKHLDAVDLGADGVLRVAYYVKQKGDIHESTIVDRLAWDRDTFEQDVVLPGQTVIDMKSSVVIPGTACKNYVVSSLGLPYDDSNPDDNGRRTKAISSWVSGPKPVVEQLRTFDSDWGIDTLPFLQVGRRGVIFVHATDTNMQDAIFASTDDGKSWKAIKQDTLFAMSPNDFDPDTNTKYVIEDNMLMKQVW